MQKKEPTAMVWLRNDLRIFDQQSLTLAKQSGLKVVAYYSFDPRHYGTTLWGFSKTAFFRAQFLIESVAELQRSLSDLNISLIIDNRPPEEGIPLGPSIKHIQNFLTKRMDSRGTIGRK